VTDQQDLFEQLCYFGTMTTDETGDRRIVRHTIAGQCLKDDIGVATPFNLSTRGNTFGIGKQDDLQQYRGIIRRSTHIVVLIVGIKYRQVESFIDQMMDRMFEGARLQLVLVVNHHHRALVIVELWL